MHSDWKFLASPCLGSAAGCFCCRFKPNPQPQNLICDSAFRELLIHRLQAVYITWGQPSPETGQCCLPEGALPLILFSGNSCAVLLLYCTKLHTSVPRSPPCQRSAPHLHLHFGSGSHVSFIFPAKSQYLFSSSPFMSNMRALLKI